MDSPLDLYVRAHSTPQTEALEWIERQTYIRTNYPRMLSGAVQGRLLTIIAKLCGSRRILEIGTFTGYSALCLAYGLEDGGIVDTLEINDELEDIIREGWSRAGMEDRIKLHIGDARNILPSMRKESYDLIYLDANKREYCEYFDLAMPLLKRGGVILADDVMLGGKVYDNPMPSDAQTLGVSRFNEMILNDRRVEVVILPIRDGLSIIRKK